MEETEDFIKTFYVEIYMYKSRKNNRYRQLTTTTHNTQQQQGAAIKPSAAEFHTGIVRFMTRPVDGIQNENQNENEDINWMKPDLCSRFTMFWP